MNGCVCPFAESRGLTEKKTMSYLNRELQGERSWGIKYQSLFYCGKTMFHFTEDGFAVHVSNGKYACLPSGVAVVFQPWNAAPSSLVTWPETFKWPDDYGAAIWVKSSDLDQIYYLTQDDPLVAEKRMRVIRRAPWHHGPSMSARDVVAMRVGNTLEVVRCDSVGWTTIETKHHWPRS
jgi:hypothetical protein